AWAQDGTGWVIDYGVIEIRSPMLKGRQPDAEEIKGIEAAIETALHEWRESVLREPYCDAEGNEYPLDIVNVDAGFRTDAIYRFVRAVGGRPFRAAMGFGSAKNQPSWSMPKQESDRNKGFIRGNQWYARLQHPSKVWLH